MREITLDSDENPDDPAFHQYLNAPCTDESVRLPGGVKAVSKPFVLICSFVRAYLTICVCRRLFEFLIIVLSVS